MENGTAINKNYPVSERFNIIQEETDFEALTFALVSHLNEKKKRNNNGKKEMIVNSSKKKKKKELKNKKRMLV